MSSKLPVVIIEAYPVTLSPVVPNPLIFVDDKIRYSNILKTSSRIKPCLAYTQGNVRP